jgi:hypothetical protein
MPYVALHVTAAYYSSRPTELPAPAWHPQMNRVVRRLGVGRIFKSTFRERTQLRHGLVRRLCIPCRGVVGPLLAFPLAVVLDRRLTCFSDSTAPCSRVPSGSGCFTKGDAYTQPYTSSPT